MTVFYVVVGLIVALGGFLAVVEGFTALAWWRFGRHKWKP